MRLPKRESAREKRTHPYTTEPILLGPLLSKLKYTINKQHHYVQQNQSDVETPCSIIQARMGAEVRERSNQRGYNPVPEFSWQSPLWSAGTFNCTHLHISAPHQILPLSNEFTYARYQQITAFPAKSSLGRGQKCAVYLGVSDRCNMWFISYKSLLLEEGQL